MESQLETSDIIPMNDCTHEFDLAGWDKTIVYAGIPVHICILCGTIKIEALYYLGQHTWDTKERATKFRTIEWII